MTEGREAQFSPDGAKIVYVANNVQKRQYDIFVMDADGGGARMLTDSGSGRNNPTWSPDGKLIAFTDLGYWVMNADGLGARRVPTPRLT